MTIGRSEVEKILRDRDSFEWQVQGFGMLRTYFGDEIRLQIWDQRLAAFGNNAVHDHPWDFASTIIVGLLYNQRYVPTTTGDGKLYWKRIIQPGIGGGSLEEPTHSRLVESPVEVYGTGERYSQRADELHVSRYAQGTITLLERRRVRDKDWAASMWPVDSPEWIFYEPRPAKPHEIDAVLNTALATWFL